MIYRTNVLLSLALLTILLPPVASATCNDDLPKLARRPQISVAAMLAFTAIAAVAVEKGADAYRTYHAKREKEIGQKRDKELITAIEQKDLSKVKELIASGANVRQDNDNPMRLALKSRFSPIINELLAAGADYPLDGALAIRLAETWNSDFTVRMLERNLHSLAFRRSPADTVRDLVANGMIKPAVFLSKHFPISPYEINQGFDILCRFHSLDTVKEMVETGLVDIRGRNLKQGPLKSAVNSGNFELADYLIEMGAQVQFENDEPGVIHELPLEQEVRFGHLESVVYLIEKGALVTDVVVDRARAELQANGPNAAKIVELLRPARSKQIAEGRLKSRYPN